MAKQIVNPLERHVEKALLAVAGVALTGVVVMYAVTSPNKVEIDGQIVTPRDIGEKLAQKTVDVRQRLKSFRPEEKEPEVLAAQFAEAREKFKTAQLASSLPAGPAIGPEVPFVDPKGAKAGQAQLVKVLKLDPPSVKYGRSTFVLQDGDVYQPANWVTVAALIKREDQSKVQALEYGSQRAEVILGPPQIQRRAMRPDGTWSDEDWVDVGPWPAARLPAPPPVLFEEEDGRQFVPRENRLAIERYQQDINYQQAQIEIIRPIFPEIHNGDRWEFPETVPCVEVLRMDDDYINRNVVEKTAESALEDRYGACKIAPPAADDPGATGIAERFAEGEKLLDSAKQTDSVMDATLAYNIFVVISLDKTVSTPQKSRADRLVVQAEQAIRDIKRKIRQGGGAVAVSPGEQQERQLHPTQLAWAHDALPGSVESGKTYQYRMRATLFNRLAGEPSRFEDSEHAKVILAAGEWSDPSEPVVVAPTTEFYVTAVDARKLVAKIEIYQWFEGYWVTTRESFKVGDRIAVTDRVQLPDLEDPDAIDKPVVSFDTGHTMLSVLSDRPFREKKGRGAGMRFQDSLSREASIVLTDSHGIVVERFVLTDKGSPTKKAASSRVWRPSKGGP